MEKKNQEKEIFSGKKNSNDEVSPANLNPKKQEEVEKLNTIDQDYDQKNPKDASSHVLTRNVEDYSEIACSLKHSDSHYDSFALCPKNMKVSFTEKQEKVILILRQHPVVYWKKILILLIMFLAPLFSFSLPGLNFFSTNHFIASYLVWYLVIFGFSLELFLLWYFNIYIITDERCIDVDFVNLLNRNISSTKIETIQDFTVEKSGFTSLLFNYGTIFIQTAASKNEFDFHNIPNPQTVSKLLNELILEEEREKLEGRVF